MLAFLANQLPRGVFFNQFEKLHQARLQWHSLHHLKEVASIQLMEYIYIGGGDLVDEYKLTVTRHYKCTSKRRSVKVINSIDEALLKAIESKEIDKFNGKLEIIKSSMEHKLNKDSFVKELRKRSDCMDNSHYMHELRCDEPDPDIDPNIGLETDVSKQLRFESYNDYKFDHFGISQLVVESLIAPELMERNATRYNVDDKFESYTGQILFMMSLDTCNVSIQRDIAGAQKRFDALTLDSFPAEDITELATEALRLIHILAGSYTLPLTLGSTLIEKAMSTSSKFFNRKMFALLDETRTLETKYKLLDPVAITNDPLYTSYGPYVICVKLQEEHGKLISDSDWPALATKLPESNSLPVASIDNQVVAPPSESTIQ